ncbi:MAG: hypothetical protein ACUVUS_01595 [Thermoproteota archaeon]
MGDVKVTEEEKKAEEIEIEKKVELEDIEELRGVLKTVREEVPGLLKDIVGPLKELMGISMTEEQARERAKAIATFYKELINAGIKEDVAMELLKNQFVSPMELIKGAMGHAKFKKEKEESIKDE